LISSSFAVSELLERFVNGLIGSLGWCRARRAKEGRRSKCDTRCGAFGYGDPPVEIGTLGQGGTFVGPRIYCWGSVFVERHMIRKYAIALTAVAAVSVSVPANAEEVGVGVGVGPVGAGVTVGESHRDYDQDRNTTTVIKERDEPREKVIVKEHEREPDRKVIIKERD
jgi:hypothetical protein